MQGTIVRKATKSGFEYSVSFDKGIIGTYSYFSFRRPVAVFRDGVEVLSMKFSFFGGGRLFFCGQEAARLKRGWWGKPYTVSWNGHDFEMRLHMGNRFSLTMDGTQIALYRKMGGTLMGSNHYKLLFSESASDMQEFLLLLCMFIDTRYYTHRASWAVYRREGTIVFWDTHTEFAEWKP